MPARHVHRRRPVHGGRAEEAVVELHGGTEKRAGGTRGGERVTETASSYLTRPLNGRMQGDGVVYRKDHRVLEVPLERPAESAAFRQSAQPPPSLERPQT